MEVGILLGLMCRRACEFCDFTLYMDRGQHRPTLDNGGILENIEVLVSLAKSYNSESQAVIPEQLRMDYLIDRKMVRDATVLSFRVHILIYNIARLSP